MDRHVQWLRLFLAARIARRLLLESGAAGVAILAVTAGTGFDLLTAALLGFFGAQVFAAIRVAMALLLNPVSYRFLTCWRDTSRFLEPIESVGGTRSPGGQTVEEHGFHHVLTLGRAGTEDRFDVYAATSHLVLVAIGTASDSLLILSKLADRRLLVTAAEIVPPHARVLVNHRPGGSFTELVTSHVERLGSLEGRGLNPVPTAGEAVAELLHFEWEAWSRLGPLFGPFLASGRRFQPLLLQARVPPSLLWHQTSTPGPAPDWTTRRQKPVAGVATSEDRAVTGAGPSEPVAAA